jgi:putative acetyltransferase
MDLIIREAEPSDAEALIAYVQRLSEEPGSNITISPGEFNPTVAEEQAILRDYASSENAIFLVAEIGGQLVGCLNCKGGHRQRTRHVVTLGISVAQAWRNQGIGSQLLAHAIAWARDTGIVKRIELLVFEHNHVAIHLYQNFGFVVEGKKRHAIFRDGEYLDNLMMALLL